MTKITGMAKMNNDKKEGFQALKKMGPVPICEMSNVETRPLFIIL